MDTIDRLNAEVESLRTTNFGLAQRVGTTEVVLSRQRRLIRWLSLTYGENMPIFHGPDRDELLTTYREALGEDDGDPAFWAAAQIATRKPEPGRPDEDWGDIPVDLVYLDHHGNTIPFDPEDGPR